MLFFFSKLSSNRHYKNIFIEAYCRLEERAMVNLILYGEDFISKLQ